MFLDDLSISEKCKKQLSKAIRSAADAKGTSWRIEIVTDNSAPTVRGKSYYWTNKSGSVIHHPQAYMRAHGNPIYNPSTRFISVGIGWIITYILVNNNVSNSKVRQ